MEKEKNYDWYSKEWYNESKSTTYDITLKHILDFVRGEKIDRAIDIGCGYGVLTKQIKDKTDFNLVAMDYDDESIRKSVNILGNSVEVKKQDILNTDYEDSEFDLVISTGYTSAASLPGAMKEIKRIVKPGGVIILDYLRFYNLYYLFSGGFFKRLFKFFKKDPEQYYFGRYGLKRYFEKEHGLKIEKIRSFYTYPPFLRSDEARNMFESTLGRVLRPFLARVLILKVRNIK